MRRLMFAAVILAMALGISADPRTDESKREATAAAMRTFAGTWEIVAAEPEGVTMNAKRLVFRKDMTYAALDKDGKELWAGTFDLDPGASPKIWDHRSYESLKTGGDALGIYELEGDELKVACVVGTWKDKQWHGKPRPTTFEIRGADVVLKLRRVTQKT